MMELDRKQAARELRRISRLLEVNGASIHRVRAFANASRVIEKVDGDLGEMIESGAVLDLKGIGKGTAGVLEELATGQQPQVLVELEAEVPEGVRQMMGLPGLGPKKVRSLWRDLGLTRLGELEYACRENRLIELKGFGPATQERVLEGLRFARRAADRRLINEAHATASATAARIADDPAVARVLVAGEVRRCCETVGRVELVVVASDTGAAAARVETVVDGAELQSDEAWTARAGDGLELVVRLVTPDRAGAAELWATGSRAHLDALSVRARDRGLELRSDGLWRGDERLQTAEERAVYEALECSWVPPELREDGREVAAAATGALPELATEGDLLGALHNHTTDSDGAASVAEMAAAAAGLGWSFLGIADHSPVATYANGVTADRLVGQWRQIDEVNASRGDVRVVKGLEADILGDGSLDIPEGCEAGLEYVVASVHSAFRLPEEQQTERLVAAVSHPACRVLGHPTGRLLLARPGYEVDVERVLTACAEHGVAVEINASPYRLDLDWRWAKRALELGLRLVINPDAHSTDGLEDVRWGVAMARKAGATVRDLVNCMEIGEFLAKRV
jgi:DNA polymerase (family 10)